MGDFVGVSMPPFSDVVEGSIVFVAQCVDSFSEGVDLNLEVVDPSGEFIFGAFGFFLDCLDESLPFGVAGLLFGDVFFAVGGGDGGEP